MIVIEQAIYGQLLVKYQPKVIENKEKYDQARRIFLVLMMQKERIPEETSLLDLVATLLKEFEEKQEKPNETTPHEV